MFLDSVTSVVVVTSCCLSMVLLSFGHVSHSFQPSFIPRTRKSSPYFVSSSSSSSSQDYDLSVSDFSLDDFFDEFDNDDNDDDDRLHDKGMKSTSKSMENYDNSNIRENIKNNLQRKDDIDEDKQSVLDFLRMVQETPVGEMEENEIQLLREVMMSLTSSHDNTEKYGDMYIPDILETLLYRLIEEWEQTGNAEAQPSVEDFMLTMQAWDSMIGNDTDKRNTQMLPTALSHVWSLFTTLEEVSQVVPDDVENSLRPTPDIIRLVLKISAASRERGIDRKAERLFQNMVDDYNIQPDPDMYEYMITMLAKAKTKGAANRGERLLRQAVDELGPQVTVGSFNSVLISWAKSDIEYGPERAEKIIILMEQAGVQPNVSSFTSLIDAYAQSNTWDGVRKCEMIFNRVLDMYIEDGDDTFEPSIVSWTVVLSAWSRLARKNNRGAGERADKLLRRMEQLYKDGRINVGPDKIVYITTMNANAFTRTEQGLIRAREILDEMYELYMDGNDEYKPTAKSIRVMIDCLVKSSIPDNVDQAQSVLECYEDHLETMMEEDPSIKDDVSDIYRCMLFGWTNVEDPEMAQSCLEEMIERGLNIDSFCFDRIIECNTKINDRNAMKRSYRIFELLEECRQNNIIKPNERVYTSFIRAMVKAKIPDIVTKSNAILDRMNELSVYDKGIQPTTFTYNSILTACSECTEEEKYKDALITAVKIFNLLRNSNNPNVRLDHVSFGNMIKCSKLLNDEKQKDALITSTFELCCNNGMINQYVIRDLKNVTSDTLYEKLIGFPMNDENVTLDDLPPSWQRVNTLAKQQQPNNNIYDNINNKFSGRRFRNSSY